MKVKSDFVTNSSSTSFIVVDTWEIKSGSMLVSQDFDKGPEVFDITKEFIAYIYKLTDHTILPNFGVVKNDDHLQLSFDSGKNFNEHILRYKKGDEDHEIYLDALDFTLNVYNNKSVEASFHYRSYSSAEEIQLAIEEMISNIMDMLKLSGIDIEGERRVVDFSGDGWDGGDPWCGHYGDSTECKKEVEGNYHISYNYGEKNI